MPISLEKIGQFFGLIENNEESSSYASREKQVVPKPKEQPAPVAQRTTASRPAVTEQRSYEKPKKQPTYTQPTYQQPKERPQMSENKKVVSMKSTNGIGQKSKQLNNQSHKITIIEPRVYSEAKDVADCLLRKEAIVVNFHLVEERQARRIVDFLTGTVYAVGGDIQRIGNEIFLCTPANMTIDGAASSEIMEKVNF